MRGDFISDDLKNEDGTYKISAPLATATYTHPHTQRELARPDSNPKSAFGIKKPSLHLVPGTALMYLAKVMALGAAKYGAHNWRDQPVAATVYVSAALRHIFQWLDGEDIDPESGAPHIAHAMADMAILLDAYAHGSLIDDRPAKGQTSQVISDLTVKDNG